MNERYAARLVRTGTGAAGAVVAVGTDPFLVGRSSQVDLDLDDPSVSGLHARIERFGAGFRVTDLGSTNGTLVNGVAAGTVDLAHGDAICFGDVCFRFELAPAGGGEQALVTTGQSMLPVPGQAGPTLPAMYETHPAWYGGPPPGAGSGLLPVLALLAAVTIIGFPLGLALGLMAYIQIRRHGGTRQDRVLTHWALGLSTVWLALFCVGTAVIAWRVSAARSGAAQRDAVSVNEAAAMRAMKGLAAAARFAQVIEWKDVDGDGVGEYPDLPVLAEVGSVFFDADLADGEAYGYRFFMQDLSEDRFLAVAEPLDYGRSGRRTFAIDQTGRLRAVDGQGRRYAELSQVPPVLSGEPNAFHEREEEIAKDILEFSRRLDLSGPDLKRVDRILDRVRGEFALTGIGQELLGMRKTTDLFLKEQRAQALFDEAAGHLEEDRLRAAIGTYEEILNEYGDYSRYEEVSASIQELRARLLDEEERAARALMEEADALERTGRQEEARGVYLQLERLYPGTETAARVRSLVGGMEQQMREKAAEELFFNLMEMDPRAEITSTLNLVDQLDRNYSNTVLYATNVEAIRQQARKARAAKWREDTLAEMAAGRTRGALARLEGAARQNPDIRYDLRDLFIELYRSVGERLVDEGDEREALRVFLALGRLADDEQDVEMDRTDAAVLAELHYKVGIAELEQDVHERALWHFSNAAHAYADDPRFQIRYGIANLYTGQYQPAIQAFRRAVELDDATPQPRLYRAYAMLRQVAVLERDLLYVFEGSPAYAPVIEQEAQAGETAAPGTNEAGLVEGPFAGVQSPPPPADLDVKLDYNFAEASALLPDSLALISELQEVMIAFEQQIDDSRGQGRMRMSAERVKQYAELTRYRNQVSAMRTQARNHEEEQREFLAVLDAIRRNLDFAAGDIEAAVRLDASLSPVLRETYDELSRKRNLYRTAALAFARGHTQELRTISDAIFCAEAVLDQLQKGIRRGLSVAKLLRDTLLRAGDRSDFDAGLLALEQALELGVDSTEVLDAAEGGRLSGAR